MPRNTDRPLTAKEQRFIRFYVKPGVRDIEKAAQLAGYKAAEGKKLWKTPEIRADIDRRLFMIEQAQTKLDAEQAQLTDELLDSQLATVVRLDAAKHGALKLNALRLGYLVRGRIKDGNSEALIPASAPDISPQIYRAVVQQQTLTQAVIETKPAPPETPAKQDPTPQIAEPIETVIRIRDY